MKSGQLQVARVGRERGRGGLQGHGLPALPAFFPFRNVKRRQGWGEAGEADGGQVTGTEMGDRRAENRGQGWD